ncbi:MAG: single-stranded-DNA-specific exonuclease RecJ [Oscillospiraceae bacterium]
MLYRPWQIANHDSKKSTALSEAFGLPRLVCDVLTSRGLTDTDDVRAFVEADTPLSSPMQLANIDKARARILNAVDKGERIAVFGDYDVDGVTATALLYTYLDGLCADVYYKLPNREDDGYGLSVQTVDYMAEKGVNLIITVDNGVSAIEAIAYAAEKGIDVVVTDHHLPPPVLPNAIAIVNPQLSEDKSEFKALSGVGVAFKLICALEGCEPSELMPFYSDLVAIGTVADIMTLTGENRVLVKAGLEVLQNTDRPGLAALIEACGFADKELTADNISYGIAPRLNAAGRMDTANTALDLLLCDDTDSAQDLVATLVENNAMRQKTEQDIAEEVSKKIIEDIKYHSERILVVEGRGYHQGVIGIVASRIVERFGKPAIIISIDENGEGKGSGRSVEGISLYDAISGCKDLLIRFGGHAMAAGLSVREENISAFRSAINVFVNANYPVSVRAPLHLDARVDLQKLTAEDIESLSLLAPFGNGNPAPLFYIENASIDALYPVSDGKHTRIRLKSGNACIYGIIFGTSPTALGYTLNSRVDAAVSLSVYAGKQGKMISARIKELRPYGMSDKYLQAAQSYEAFCCKEQISQDERILIKPQRADTVAVYKRVCDGGLPANDLRPLFAQLGSENAGKILVSLSALCELGLVEKKQKDGAEFYIAAPVTEKKNLASASILRSLEE